MDNEAMKEALNELFSHLERLEAQSEAILQFLKEKKRVSEKQLALYLEQAANASNVKWRAARVRIDHLLSPEQQEKETKLGKRPELHEESRRADSSDAEPDKQPSASSSEEKRSASADKEEKRSKPVDEEAGKRAESGDQKQIESNDNEARQAKPEDQGNRVKAVQAHPSNGKTDKAEAKSELNPASNEQAAPKNKNSEEEAA